MPPRRSSRASSSRLFDGSSEAGGPIETAQSPSMRNAVAGRGMSPGPAKYSSAYGSPPTIMPARQNVARQRYSLTSALSRVIDSVDEDNENDARERAVREASEQRRKLEVGRSLAAAQALAQAQEEDEEASRQLQDMDSSPSSREDPAPAPAPVRHSEAPPPPPPPGPAEDSPPRSFSEEDRIFREAQILTPILPSRGGVVARTSNIVQNLLNSARRFSTRREEAEDEAVSEAYPHLSFIRPRQDNTPPPGESSLRATDPVAPHANGSEQAEPRKEAEKEAEAEKLEKWQDPPASVRRGSRRTKSRIATPGPTLRTRARARLVDTSADELAMEETTATSRHASGLKPMPKPILALRQEPMTLPPVHIPAATPPQPVSSTERETETDLPKRGWTKSVHAFACDVGELSKGLAMAITVLVLSFVAVRVFVISTSSPALYEAYRVDNRLHWYGRDWRSNLRQLVPFALVHPLGALSDDEFAQMNGLILSHANEVAQMRHAQRLHGDALERINRILPAVVHMQLDRHGRPVVSQEFWHALRDSILADKDIFSLIRHPDGSLTISDLQWTALRHQLDASGLLPDPRAKALSVRDVEGIAATAAEATLSKSWETWLRRNQNKVREMLGVDTESQPQQPATDLEHLSDRQLARLAQQVVASDQVRAVIVPKQEFLQILQSSFVEHRREIKGELAELEARVVELARAAAAAVSSASGRPVQSPAETGTHAGAGRSDYGGDLTKKEVMQIVDQLVRKGISDAQLEAMARGTIKADWQTNLVHQVNFFSKNTGATVNHHFTSPSYNPVKPSSWSRLLSWGRSGGSGSGGTGGDGDDSIRQGRPMPGSMRGSVAFEAWEQDGDCWCGAMLAGKPRKHRKHGKQGSSNSTTLAVKLGLRVVPQHLVVEHISPSATLDPGAMPKQLEVWAQITDYAAQRPLQDWSLSQFPDTSEDETLSAWGFVQIGAFAFAASHAGNSVQVYRLSSELEALEAVTDHLLVRATSNHGAADHTCFYRLRLYGQPRPDVVE